MIVYQQYERYISQSTTYCLDIACFENKKGVDSTRKPNSSVVRQENILRRKFRSISVRRKLFSVQPCGVFQDKNLKRNFLAGTGTSHHPSVRFRRQWRLLKPTGTSTITCPRGQILDGCRNDFRRITINAGLIFPLVGM